ncbi:MAG: hypothetical protein II393_02325 [Cytophagales bacterium]|nr:hypothetical protein [Cytophagales bacterium]
MTQAQNVSSLVNNMFPSNQYSNIAANEVSKGTKQKQTVGDMISDKWNNLGVSKNFGDQSKNKEWTTWDNFYWGMRGALKGGATGATVGGAVGSVIPGSGSTIGAAAGGVTGATKGAINNTQAAKAEWEKVHNPDKVSGEYAKDTPAEVSSQSPAEEDALYNKMKARGWSDKTIQMAYGLMGKQLPESRMAAANRIVSGGSSVINVPTNAVNNFGALVNTGGAVGYGI